LLVRDYTRRWQKGWRSILILGAAYGIIEEGIMVRSFFNPAWKDLGVLGSYGRWLGTNWVWAEWLAVYHAIFSITIPIFLVELTFPQSKTRIWLSSRMRVLFHGLLILAIILGFFAFPYDPGVLPIAFCIAAVVALGWLAKQIPNISPAKRNLKVSWKVLIPLGLSVPAIFFFFFNSALIPIAAGTVIIGGFMVLGYERLLTRLARRGFTDLQKLGLMTGALGFFALFFDFILDLVLGRVGTSVLGVAFIVYLLWIRKRILLLLPGKLSSVQIRSEMPGPSEPGAR
jgi:hypothetical protein